jgi:phosphoribosylformylglycinamidine cyclo-ligase
MPAQKIDYKSAGVDIGAASVFKSKLKDIVKASFGPEVIKSVGGFGGFYRFKQGVFRDPILVSSSDGVGTKIKIAILAGRHDTVGIDAVAMNVNDILCTGAAPLFFLDYVAYSRLSSGILTDIVRGLTAGCIQAGCALIGGETAQMPGMYAPGEYDLAGFCVGVVDRRNIIDGSRISPGDAIIGLASSGIHSNGYSLVRKVLPPAEQKKHVMELLTPTRIYVKPVLALLKKNNSGAAKPISGISHITGGAFYDKIARVLPGGIDARIDKGTWTMPPIFRLIESKGAVAEKELYHTLNMGIGMVVFVRKNAVAQVLKQLQSLRVESWVIGEAVKGSKRVHMV